MAIRKFSHLAALLAALLAVVVTAAPPAQAQAADPLSTDNILRDPDIQVLGNPKGDVTIVEYFDYNCPYCRKIEPVLHKIARDDGRIRLVFKDWPILGKASVHAARFALAAKYQGKYAEAHTALISATGRLSEANIPAVLAKAGIDVERAKRDLAARGQEIDALLARNNEQATALGFRGTPAFIVGKFRVPGALDEENFKQAIADSRAAAKQK
ncbi:MAG: DsbA family protein [Pseudolabrys sp.]|nr:DsbA family protein [Pseudolabrys sp.]